MNFEADEAANATAIAQVQAILGNITKLVALTPRSALGGAPPR